MAVISEHEQLPQQGSLPADQPQENEDIVKKVNKLLSRSKKHRKRYDTEWHYNYEFVCSGKQWPIDRPRWRFNESVNITWSAIMTEIALQTDGRPKFEFTAQEFGDDAFIDILRDINDSNWEKYKWSQVVQDALFDCKLYHVAHAIVEWNPELESGLGDVDFKILDPFHCYWDPMASDVNKGDKCRWFIYAKPVPTNELKQKYPKLKDKIKPDAQGLNNKKEWSSGPNTTYVNFDPYSPTRLPSSAGAQGDLYGGEDLTILIRCWMRDDTMEELCEESEENGEKKEEYVLKKKYPKGRYIEIANNVLLRDGAPGVEVDRVRIRLCPDRSARELQLSARIRRGKRSHSQ
jgi:hypothetical protein